MRAGTAATTEIVQSRLSVSIAPVEGRMNTYQVASVSIDYTAYVTWNRSHMDDGSIPRYIQYAEYQHYASYAGSIGDLAWSIYERINAYQPGTETQLQQRWERTIQNMAISWYNRQAEISGAYDAPGGSHTPGGPPIAVPSDFLKFE